MNRLSLRFIIFEFGVKRLSNAMPDLNEDVEKVIASFCNENDIRNLARVSKKWKYAAESARLNYEGPINGDTISYYALERNGLCHMPFVNVIKADSLSNTTNFAIFVELCGPQLNDVRKKWRPHLELDLEIDMNENLLHQLQSLHFACVYIKNFSFTNTLRTKHIQFVTDEAVVYPSEYLQNTFVGLISLKLYNISNILPMDHDSIQKALQEQSLRRLEVTGLFTDTIMSNLTFQSRNLTTLHLHYQSICSWTFAHKLQRALPNIEDFALKSSNILLKHVNEFDWNLWPRLHSLNFENNLTLVGHIDVPKTLTKLYLAFTRAFVNIEEFSLREYSANVYYFDLNKLIHISKLRLHLMSFWQDEYCTYFKDLCATQITILFKDFFAEHCFASVRKQLPNCLITKLNLLEG